MKHKHIFVASIITVFIFSGCGKDTEAGTAPSAKEAPTAAVTVVTTTTAKETTTVTTTTTTATKKKTTTKKETTTTSETQKAAEDTDDDGLSDIKEEKLGTDLMNEDTDNDGLKDGEEVKKYKSDPLKPDTDDDGLPDGDEVHIKLDPTNPKTHSVPDAEYVSTQSIKANSRVLSQINTKDNAYELSIEYTGTGYAEGNMTAEESGYANAIGSDMVLGTIPEIMFGDTCKPQKIVLKFKIKSEYKQNEIGIYAAENDELEGIKRLNVFGFFPDVNAPLPLVTEFDTASDIVYAEIEEPGTYYLIDMEKLLSEWGISPDETGDIE